MQIMLMQKLRFFFLLLQCNYVTSANYAAVLFFWKMGETYATVDDLCQTL